MISRFAVVRRVALSLCLFSSVSFAANQPFFPVLQYEPYAVPSPTAMAEGDLNGDGVPDTLYATASATPGSTTLTVALRSANSGTAPTLSAPSAIPCTANSILLADLNNDKKLDAVVTCKENTVAVLAGNGDGTFSAATTYSVVAAAKAVAADFNGDGYLDLAIATNTGTTASAFAVLLNSRAASPAFAASVTYGGPIGTSWISVGDLNGDGRPDIAAGISQSTGALFTAESDGSFKPFSLTGFPTGTMLTIANLDGDTLGDVIYIFPGADSRYIGTVLSSTSKVAPNQFIPTNAADIRLLDLNGDGRSEIVITGTAVTVLSNEGNGALSIGGSWTAVGSLYATRKLSNGSTDLVFATPRGFYTLHGDGKAGFDGLPAIGPMDVGNLVDTNQDGVPDLIGADATTQQWIYAQGRGNGVFQIAQINYSGYTSFTLVGDYTGDGVPDVLEIRNSRPLNGKRSVSYGIWPVNNPPGIGTPLLSGPLGINDAIAAVAGDFDGDGRQDFVVAASDTPTLTSIYLARKASNGTFVTPLALIGSSNIDLQARPLAVDLDHDGRLDIVCGSTVYMNRTTGFVAMPLGITGIVLAAGDLNGDGNPDLVIDNAVYAGNGDGSFASSPIYTITVATGAIVPSASIGDVNGDGNPDVVLQTFTDMASLIVVHGDGHGSFTPDLNDYTFSSQPPISGTLTRLNNQAPALAADNRLDYVAFAGRLGISLLNQTNPTPGPASPLPSSLKLLVNSGVNFVPLQSVPFYASIIGLNPTGTVSFKLADGTVVGTASVSNANAVTYGTIALPGTYAITANYSGDANNAPSVSAPVTITVQKAITTLTVTLPFQAYAGRSTTIGANLSSGFHPTGAITLTSNGQPIGTITPDPTSGISNSSLRYTFPDTGTYTIAANFAGDASNLPSVSGATSLAVVPAPDFTLSATPTSVAVTAGQTATWNITVSSINNYSGNVTLACQQDNCGNTTVYVSPAQTGQATFTLQTKATSSPQSRPSLRIAPVAASALFFLALSRRKRRWLPSCLSLGLLAVCLGSIAGCSSSKASSTTTQTPPTAPVTSNFAITGTDSSMQVTHNLTLTLIVNPS